MYKTKIGKLPSKTPDLVVKITNKDLKPKKKPSEKQIFVIKYK